MIKKGWKSNQNGNAGKDGSMHRDGVRLRFLDRGFGSQNWRYCYWLKIKVKGWNTIKLQFQLHASLKNGLFLFMITIQNMWEVKLLFWLYFKSLTFKLFDKINNGEQYNTKNIGRNCLLTIYFESEGNLIVFLFKIYLVMVTKCPVYFFFFETLDLMLFEVKREEGVKKVAK